jgi:hypothetical protein
MPMQVTGLSTCHVPTDYVAPDEPVIPRVKSAGSLKRKERGEGDGQVSSHHCWVDQQSMVVDVVWPSV